MHISFHFFPASVNNRQGKSIMCLNCVVGIVSIVGVVCVIMLSLISFDWCSGGGEGVR